MKKAIFLTAIIFPILVFSQIKKAPEIKEGEGPWTQLIIRGVTLINGNGAPPTGPVDIVIEQNRIVQVASAGSPGMPPSKNRPQLKEGGKNQVRVIKEWLYNEATIYMDRKYDKFQEVV